MDEHDFESYLSGSGHHFFHRVFALSAHPQPSWDEISIQIPTLPRAWFELARLAVEDRIEFTRAFWLSQLPFVSATYTESFESFFDQIETIEIYATQLEPDHPFEVHMVYALEHDSGFFQGCPGATEEELTTLQRQFTPITFPSDYLAFLRIHNGFSKYTDTGLIKTKEMPRLYRHFQELLRDEELVRPDGMTIAPTSLIPFYESFGLHCYQCYYADWYVAGEMGTVYFSEHDRTISNFLDTSRLEENLAFPTFLGWLVFYVEDIWHL